MREIKWKNKAIKQLGKVAKVQQPAIVAAIDTLLDYQHNLKVKKLTNHRYDYRLRVGNYRVLFDVDVGSGTVEIVWIEEVRKRDERTY